ncbi:MAG: DUF6152 family protein [Woeseiaceae bacterium]
MNHSARLTAALILLSSVAGAHHNPIVYDGKTTVTISGTVTAARYGFPHSQYAIDVTNEDGQVEKWLLMTEDPRDAQRLGFDEAIKAIKAGDPITVVGWPNKIKAREIRGHQLHYPDGTVVMMRRGNYIWTNDLKRIWRLSTGRDEFPGEFEPLAESATAAEQIAAWIEEDDVVTRVAYIVANGDPRLIGIDSGDGYEFDGVPNMVACHVDRASFRLEIDFDKLDTNLQSTIDDGGTYISKFNSLLSRYWEYEVANC